MNLPEEYGGGGMGISELAIVSEELAAHGCPLLLLMVSPAICGTLLARFGTQEQRRALAAADRLGRAQDGVRDHRARRRVQHPQARHGRHPRRRRLPPAGPQVLHLRGRRGRRRAGGQPHRGRRGHRPGPALALRRRHRRPRARTGTPIELHINAPEKQFFLFFDDVGSPADRLLGDEGDGLRQVFNGLNPERIIGAAAGNGIARYALAKAAAYANQRQVWGVPIGTHQGLAHPLAEAKIEVELARLMTQKAAWATDAGVPGAGEAANMAKYAAAEAAMHAVDAAIQTHGGNGLAAEYGLADLWGMARLLRTAPVSREMILNFVAEHSLRLPRSY